MVLQYRPPEGGLPYSPSRDLTNFFPELVKTVAHRLEDQRLAAVHLMLKEKQVTDEDLGEACGAYCRFLVIAHEKPEESFEDVLKRSGWYDVKPEAQIAYLTYVGMTMTGYFYMGIRDVMRLGETTRTEISQLVRYGERARLLMSMPPLRRWLYMRFRPLRRWMLRFRKRRRFKNEVIETP